MMSNERFLQTRREFLSRGLAVGTGLGLAALGSLAAVAPGAGAEPQLKIIDTHTHFYDPSRPKGVPWPGRDDRLLYRTVLPAEYRRLTAEEGVVGTVVVEASAWVEDNQWLLDLAEQDSLLVGIVGHLEPRTPEFAPLLERFAGHKRYRGIRIGSGLLKQKLDDRAFLDDLRRFARLGLTLDINGGPDMLADIAKLAGEIEDLRIMVNHLANVQIDGEEPPAQWRTGMRAAAVHSNVWCKLSALVEGASRPDQLSPALLTHYRPTLDVAWETFGARRLVYGSNWPVSARFAPYATVQRLALEFARLSGEEATRRVMGENAVEAYGLKSARAQD